MKIVKRILPVLCIIVVTLIISRLLYGRIVEHEKNRCWQELSSTAQSVKKEITTKFKDEIVKLHLIEQAMIDDELFRVEDIDVLHLETIQPTTIFSRVDVLYPDNTLISNGTEYIVEQDISFDELMKKGEGLSCRKTDFLTQRECVYYILPVTKNDEIFAILVAVIDAQNLSTIFQPLIYNGQANICIIDTRDGSYVMDSWHDELSNVYEMGDREQLKEYEDIDFHEDLVNLKTNMIAFESRTTGKPLYMYYTSMDMFDWQLLIFAQEDVFFRELIHFRKLFLVAGIVEALLLLLYFLLNLHTVKQLEKSNAEIEKQKEELKQISYRDMLTSMYNRNKYTKVLDTIKLENLEKVGVAYIDLNGLKKINDSKSHAAGDRYICNTAKLILEVFKGESYRIGGDEFVIIATDMEKEEFINRMATLQENMKKMEISASIGFLWKESCNDLDVPLREAEKQMYQKKQEYHLFYGR